MKCFFFLKFILLFLLTSCSPSTRLTVAFTEKFQIEEGEKVVANNIHIGSIKTIKLNKTTDTAFMLIKLKKGMKVPIGSIFFLQESLVGNTFINVEYSNDSKFLSKHDISIGRLKKY